MTRLRRFSATPIFCTQTVRAPLPAMVYSWLEMQPESRMRKAEKEFGLLLNRACWRRVSFALGSGLTSGSVTAIESGLLAASVIASSRGRYGRDQVEPYRARVTERLGQ